MIKFVEFHYYEEGEHRVSVDVFSIMRVIESPILDSKDTITTLELNFAIGLNGERMPVTIAVKESYDEVMYQIRSAINAT